jgi:hypothetical protein
MRILIASLAMMLSAAVACGPAPKPEGPIVKEGAPVADTCCCKTTPITSENGLPIYQAGQNRMECSTSQGTCVDDVQCTGKGDDGGGATSPGPTSEPE